MDETGALIEVLTRKVLEAVRPVIWRLSLKRKYEDESATYELTWRPVVQSCVADAIKTLTDRVAGEDDGLRFSDESLMRELKPGRNPGRAKRLGIGRRRDEIIVRALIVAMLADPPLFRPAKILSRDGKHYYFHCFNRRLGVMQV